MKTPLEYLSVLFEPPFSLDNDSIESEFLELINTIINDASKNALINAIGVN